MSEMSYLEKLLDGVEVEWKSLGEIATKIYSGGTPDTKRIEYWENGTIPWMSSGEVNLKNIERTEKYITEAGLNNSSAKLVPRNSVVIALAGQGKTRGKVARIRIALATNQSLAALTFDEKKFSSDYVFHFLETQYESLRQISSGNSGRGGLNLQMISAYKIPIPCPGNPEKSLAIQSEIVRILDKFTELTAELTAELSMRKKQYNYYRDQLLSFDEEQEKPIYQEKLLDGVEVEWLPLSDLARIRNGKDHKSLSEGEFPVYGSGGIMRYVDTYAYNKPSVLIPRKGSLGNLFFIDVPFWTVDTIFYTEIDEAQIRPKYLYYFLTTVGLGEMNQAGGVPSQTQSVLNKLKIPIPCPDNPEKSLAIQSEIVRILDKIRHPDKLHHRRPPA
ncbi:restriction endonuclease subunit S [Escherichia coli]|uniref:restriction endonuclease subunit S n=1 Tax=Escherichia coli TaxID=562 RepID=UPI0021CE2010|nr:restriction endonuclease subunit S [Escherichia coli]